MTRVLAWDGCVNVRDLGGLPTRDGGRTRAAALVRGDSAHRLSDEGWRALVEHGVRTVVDLRWPEERGEEPPDGVPVRVVHVSLFGERDPAAVARIDAGLDGEERIAETYLELLRRHRPRFAEVARVVADAEQGGVFVHCSAGKDRTGLVAALLLALAEVEPEAIAEDYAQTEAALDELKRRWVEAAADERDRAEREARRTPTPRQAMLDVLAALDAEGGAEGFLRAGGLDDERIRRLRGRLRAGMRDLGGLPTEDGGETRRGSVFRGDASSRLDAGVRTVVDLRCAAEVEGEPPPAPGVVRVPLMGEDDAAYLDDVAARGLSLAGWYLDTLDRHAGRVREALAAVADAPPGAVLVHCVGGRDRTGIVCALLLRLAGVDAGTVADDYAAGGGLPREAMAEVLAELDRRGGVPAYLRGIGLDDERIARLRERLR